MKLSSINHIIQKKRTLLQLHPVRRFLGGSHLKVSHNSKHWCQHFFTRRSKCIIVPNKEKQSFFLNTRNTCKNNTAKTELWLKEALYTQLMMSPFFYICCLFENCYMHWFFFPKFQTAAGHVYNCMFATFGFTWILM